MDSLETNPQERVQLYHALQEEMATHSSTLAWKIPWTEELRAGHCPWGRKESGTTEQLPFHFHFLNPYTTTGKTIALTIQNFAGKVVSLL